MHPKDADGMANSVDPDQTASSEAVWSWSALFAETYLSQYIEFVRYNSSYTSTRFCAMSKVSLELCELRLIIIFFVHKGYQTLLILAWSIY